MTSTRTTITTQAEGILPGDTIINNGVTHTVTHPVTITTHPTLGTPVVPVTTFTAALTEGHLNFLPGQMIEIGRWR